MCVCVCVCVYYYDYLYVFYYMLDIGERAIELMFSVYSHTDENKDYQHLLSTNKNEHCRQVIEAIEKFAFPARTPCLDWCGYWQTLIMSQMIQDDIDKLVKWSEKWQMLFNFGKCKCLHIGPGNTSMTYEMGGTILSITEKEKDVGVTMNANMKVSEQCRIAASKGYQVLGMIRRNITYKDKSLIVPLYKAIVRPHLDYCIHAWSPYLRKDIDMLEKIRRRVTKLIPGLRDLSYEERLKECGLTTLETRRLRGGGTK